MQCVPSVIERIGISLNRSGISPRAHYAKNIMSDMNLATPLVIGHRGASGYRPEHTESAYRLALQLGADAVEPDVVATKDGVLVVRHENDISSTTNVASRPEFAHLKTTKVVDGVKHTGWFTEDFTWAQLQSLRAVERLRKIRSENTAYDGQERLLRLAEVLSIMDDEGAKLGVEPLVVIELKHAAYFASIGQPLEPLLQRELKLAGWQDRPERLIVECFERTILESLRAAGITAKMVFLLESRGAPADEVIRNGADAAHTFEWYRTDEGLDALAGVVDGISVAKRDLFDYGVLGISQRVNDLVARAHARGLSVYTWTLRPENYFLNQRFRVGAHPATWGDWRAEFEAVLGSGVDGIFVDHVDLGVSAVQHRLVAP